MVSNTGLSSPGELEITRSTSEVAACCSRASESSCASRAVFLFRRGAPGGGGWGRAPAGAAGGPVVDVPFFGCWVGGPRPAQPRERYPGGAGWGDPPL